MKIQDVVAQTRKILDDPDYMEEVRFAQAKPVPYQIPQNYYVIGDDMGVVHTQKLEIVTIALGDGVTRGTARLK